MALNKKEKEILKRVLEENSESDIDIDSILYDLQDNKLIVEDAFEGSKNGAFINSKDWFNVLGIEQSFDETSHNQKVLIYPTYADEKFTGFDIYTGMTSKKNKNTLKVTGKIKNFSLQELNDGFVNRGYGRGYTEGVLGTESKKFGTTYSSNRSSYTFVNAVSHFLDDSINYFNGKKIYEGFKTVNLYNKITHQDDFAFNLFFKNKLHESFRVISNAGTLDVEHLPATGYFSGNYFKNEIDGEQIGFFKVLELNTEAKERNIRNVLKELDYRANNSNDISQVKDALMSNADFFFKKNLINNTTDFSSYENALLAIDMKFKEGYVDGIASKDTYKRITRNFFEEVHNGTFEATTDNYKKYFFEKAGINSILENYSQRIDSYINKNFQTTTSLTNNELDNIATLIGGDIDFLSTSYVSNALFDGLNKKETVSGGTLNNLLNDNVFAETESYTIDQLRSLEINENSKINYKLLNLINPSYNVNGQDVKVNIPYFFNEELNSITIDANISPNTLNRVRNFNIKRFGNYFLNELQDHGLGYNQIVKFFESSNSLIKDIQNGNDIDLKKINALESLFKTSNTLKENTSLNTVQLNAAEESIAKSKEMTNMFREMISSGVEVSVSDMMVRGKTISHGQSSLVGSQITGGLTALNKPGPRGYQALETLTDYVYRTKDNKGKTIYKNAAVIDSDNSKKTGVLPSNLFVNKNMVFFNEVERNMKQKIGSIDHLNARTRDNVKGITLNIFGTYDQNGKFIEGSIAHNEAAYMTSTMANSLIGSKEKTFSVGVNRMDDFFKNYEEGMYLKEYKKIKKINDGADLLDFFDKAGISLNNNSVSFKRIIKALKTVDQNQLGLAIIDAVNKNPESILKSEFLNLLYSKIDSGEANFLENTINEFDLVKNEQEFLDFADTILKKNNNEKLYNSVFKRSKMSKVAKGFLRGLQFSDGFNVNSVKYNSQKGTFEFQYSDAVRAKSGTKIHSDGGDKFTLSAVYKSITSQDYDLESGKIIPNTRVNASMLMNNKSFNRGFDGADIYGLIQAALYFSDNPTETLESFKKVKVNKTTLNILDLLGLDVEFDGNTFSFFDNNSGIGVNDNVEDFEKSIRHTFNNPFAKSTYQLRKTIKKFHKNNITGTQQVLSLINQAYSSVNPDAPSLFGPMQITTGAGDEMLAAGFKTVKSVAVSAAHQKSAMESALKIDTMLSRFFDDKGIEELGEAIRTRINDTAYKKFFNSIYTPDNDYIGRILNGTLDKSYINALGKSLKNNKNINLFDINTSKINSVINEEFFDTWDGTRKLFNIKDFFNSDYIKDSNANVIPEIKTLLKALTKDDFVITTIYSGTEYDYFLKSLNKLIEPGKNIESTDFNSVIRSFHTALINKDNFDENSNAKKALNNFLKTIKGKEDSSTLYRMMDLLNKTTDSGDIARIISLIENSENANSASPLFNGFFKDQKGEVFYNFITRKLRNAKKINDFYAFDSFFNDIATDYKNGELLINLNNYDSFNNTVNNFLNKFNSNLPNFNDFDIYFSKFLSEVTKSDFDISRLVNLRKKYIYAAENDSVEVAGEILDKFNAEKSKIKTSITYKGALSNVFLNSESFLNLEEARMKFLTSLGAEIFKPNQEIIEDLTKKGTMFTKKFAYRTKGSVAGHFMEGSHVLNFIKNTIKKDFAKDEFSNLAINKTRAYKEMTEFFGKTIVDEIIFKDFNSNIKTKNFDVTMLDKLFKQIDNLEGMSIVSTEALRRVGAHSVGDIFDKMKENNSFKGVNGFLGFLSRSPVQSAQHFNPSFNFVADKGSKTFIEKYLKRTGFHDSEIGVMLLGKKTPLAMYQDFDGDAPYLTSLDGMLEDLFANDASTVSKVRNKFAMTFMVENSILNNKSLKAFGIKRTKENLKTFDKIKEFQSYYNKVNESRLYKEMEKHGNAAQMIFSSSENSALYLKYLEDIKKGKTGERFFNKIVNNAVKNGFRIEGIDDVDITKRTLKAKLKTFLDSGIKDHRQISNMLVNAFGDSQIDLTGGVYYSVNNIRNMLQLTNSMEFNEKTVNGLIKAYAHNNKRNISDPADYRVLVKEILDDINKETGSNIDSIDELATFMATNKKLARSGVNKNDIKSFLGIELGIISAKKNEKPMFMHLTRIFNDILDRKNENVMKNIFNFDDADLIADNLAPELEEKLKKLHSVIFSSNSSNDLERSFSELGKSLLVNVNESTDYLLKHLPVLEQKYLNNGRNISLLNEKLSFENIMNNPILRRHYLDAASNLKSSYDSAFGMSMLESVFAAINSRLGSSDDVNKLRKNSKIKFLTNTFGLDLNLFTRNGKRKGINQVTDEIISNPLNSNILEEHERVVSIDQRIKLKSDESFVDEDILNEEVVNEAINHSKETKTIKKAVKETTEETSNKFKLFSEGFTKKNFAIGTGLLAIGAFIGYNIGNKEEIDYDGIYDDQLGSLNYNQQREQNNLGYYNQQKNW